MALSEITELIEKRLQTNWLMTDVAWHNTNYTPVRGTPYIEPQTNIIGVESKGLKCDRHFFNTMILVRTPNGIGTGDIMRFCDSLVNLFRAFSSGTLLVKKAHAEDMGSGNEWQQRNVIIEGQYDQYYS